MRKYRNGKQSREPRQLSKYSPEYLQYRGSRGGYSVKVGLCDITGDGDADTISVAWRNPANGKVENCTVIIPPVQIPVSGPSSLAATESVPASGPSSLAASESVPANGPSSLAASEQIVVPVFGPSNLSATESVPVSGPSSLAASTIINFDVDTPTTDSGYTDSASRKWFVSYSSFDGYIFNVNPDGTAYITDPNGVSTDVTDSSTTVPDTDGSSMISNISAYDYSGNGDTEVASFDYIPTPAP